MTLDTIVLAIHLWGAICENADTKATSGQVAVDDVCYSNDWSLATLCP